MSLSSLASDVASLRLRYHCERNEDDRDKLLPLLHAATIQLLAKACLDEDVSDHDALMDAYSLGPYCQRFWDLLPRSVPWDDCSDPENDWLGK